MKRQGRLGKPKHEPQRKGNSRDSPFTSKFFVILSICGHGRTLFTTHFPPFLNLSQLYPLSILSFIQTVNLMSCGRSRDVFFSLSYSHSLSLKKYAVKRADYWMALKLLFGPLISQSTSLCLFHSCILFWPLTQPLPSLFI